MKQLSRCFCLENDVAINTTATDSDLFGTYPGRTALLAASRRGYDGVVKLLLSRNDVDINSQDEDGQTAFLLASCNGHEANSLPTASLSKCYVGPHKVSAMGRVNSGKWFNIREERSLVSSS
jgi:ankyrin repeat protein